MKTSTYMTRALQSRDRRYTTILGKLGYSPSTSQLVDPSSDYSLSDLQAAYKQRTGEEPDKRWGIRRLKAELEEID